MVPSYFPINYNVLVRSQICNPLLIKPTIHVLYKTDECITFLIISIYYLSVVIIYQPFRTAHVQEFGRDRKTMFIFLGCGLGGHLLLYNTGG